MKMRVGTTAGALNVLPRPRGWNLSR
jgi:hypothetical protein